MSTTTEPLTEPLTEQQKRVKIAECCPSVWKGDDHHLCVWDNGRSREVIVFDPFMDQNCCAIMRASLSKGERGQYAMTLAAVVFGEREISYGGDHISETWETTFRIIDATAAKHCEAFARIKNLW